MELLVLQTLGSADLVHQKIAIYIIDALISMPLLRRQHSYIIEPYPQLMIIDNFAKYIEWVYEKAAYETQKKEEGKKVA